MLSGLPSRACEMRVSTDKSLIIEVHKCGIWSISYLCIVRSLNDIIDILKRNKQRLTEKYGLRFMAVFGSYGRGQQTETSDIDILVDFQKPIGIEFIDLAAELEKLLRSRVDLVSKNGVKPQYLKQIEQDLNYV